MSWTNLKIKIEQGSDVDGLGSVNVSGSDYLNYRGLAEITTKESFLTNTIARLSRATLKTVSCSFPFRIGGTIDSPNIFQWAAHIHSRAEKFHCSQPGLREVKDPRKRIGLESVATEHPVSILNRCTRYPWPRAAK